MKRLLIFALLSTLLLVSRASAAATYGGGPIIDRPHVVEVLWQNYDSFTYVGAGAVYEAVLNSTSVSNFLQEYNTSTQTFGAGTWQIVPIRPHNTSTSLLEAGYLGHYDVADELTWQIGHGGLPASTSETIYAVHLPPGATVTTPAGVSCQDWRGFHYYAEGLQYIVVPDFAPPSTCPDDPSISATDDLRLVTSHELIEAMTDPQLDGWTPEVGDPCTYKIINSLAVSSVVDPFTHQSVTVQRIWSNAANSCAALEPTSLCCIGTVGHSTHCVGIGLNETCPVAGDASASIPVVTGSRYSLSMFPKVATQATSGIYSPLSGTQGEAAHFVGTFVGTGASSTVCLDPERQSGAIVYSCACIFKPACQCTADPTYISPGNYVCGTVPNVLVQ